MGKEVLRAFSQRRTAIEAELDRNGRTGPGASEAACLMTRRDKVDVELAELRETWESRARALGVDRQNVEGLLDGTDRRVPLTPGEVEVVREQLVGASGLTRQHAAFTRDNVLVAWEATRRQGIGREALERVADDTLASPSVVPLVVADETGRPLTTDRPRDRHTIVRLVRSPASGIAMLTCAARYSTTEMLGIEARLLALGRDGKSRRYGVVDPTQLTEVLTGVKIVLAAPRRRRFLGHEAVHQSGAGARP